MRKREFSKILRDISVTKKKKKYLDKGKATALPLEMKAELTKHIVKHRGPVLREFLVEDQQSWLAACGYSYRYTSNGYDFLGTCEHYIRFKKTAPPLGMHDW